MNFDFTCQWVCIVEPVGDEEINLTKLKAIRICESLMDCGRIPGSSACGAAFSDSCCRPLMRAASGFEAAESAPLSATADLSAALLVGSPPAKIETFAWQWYTTHDVSFTSPLSTRKSRVFSTFSTDLSNVFQLRTTDRKKQALASRLRTCRTLPAQRQIFYGYWQNVVQPVMGLWKRQIFLTPRCPIRRRIE